HGEQRTAVDPPGALVVEDEVVGDHRKRAEEAQHVDGVDPGVGSVGRFGAVDGGRSRLRGYGRLGWRGLLGRPLFRRSFVVGLGRALSDETHGILVYVPLPAAAR